MSEERAGYHTAQEGDETPREIRVAVVADNITPFPGRTFTQVDNSYYDRVMGHVSPAAWLVLSALHRLTLGYHSMSASASLGDLTRMTGVSENTVMKALAELEAAQIIGSNASERARTQKRTYTLLPESSWNLPTPTTAEIEVVSSTAKTEVDAPTTTAEIEVVQSKTTSKIEGHINKERNKGRERKLSCPTPDGADDGAASSSSKPKPRTTTPKPLAEDSEALRLAAYLRDKILAHSPQARDAKAALKPAKLANWAIPIDRMLRLDQRTPEGIRAVIDFATTDDFWHGNILSTGKLRDQYDTLDARRRSKSRPKPPYPSTGRPSQPEPSRLPFGPRPLNAKPVQPD